MLLLSYRFTIASTIIALLLDMFVYMLCGRLAERNNERV